MFKKFKSSKHINVTRTKCCCCAFALIPKRPGHYQFLKLVKMCLQMNDTQNLGLWDFIVDNKTRMKTALCQKLNTLRLIY